MQYILKPSLQHMCLATIAAQLWTADFLAEEFTSDLKHVLPKMLEKVNSIQWPTHLKNQLLSFIKPMGKQIYFWNNYLRDNYDGKAINLQDVRWTSYGTIDHAKSVQLLLQRDQSLELKQRYRLACTFCLVEQVQELLQEMPEEEKLPAQAYSRLVSANEQDLVVYFTQHVKHQLNSFQPLAYPSPYHEACHVAILSRNPTATKYFFRKLSSEEKDLMFSFVLVKFRYNWPIGQFFFPPDEFKAELGCFLLSQMDEKQRVEFFKQYPGWVVENLVIWPYHRHFLLGTINRMWDYLRRRDFSCLFNIIQHVMDKKAHNCEGDNNYYYCEYRELRLELWRSSPVEFRKYFVQDLTINCLYAYFYVEEMELLRLVLDEMGAKRKERLICEDWWDYEKVEGTELWNFFKFYVEKYARSREVVMRFKVQLITSDLKFENYESKQFLRYLDNFYPA